MAIKTYIKDGTKIFMRTQLIDGELYIEENVPLSNIDAVRDFLNSDRIKIRYGACYVAYKHYGSGYSVCAYGRWAMIGWRRMGESDIALMNEIIAYNAEKKKERIQKQKELKAKREKLEEDRLKRLEIQEDKARVVKADASRKELILAAKKILEHYGE